MSLSVTTYHHHSQVLNYGSLGALTYFRIPVAGVSFDIKNCTHFKNTSSTYFGPFVFSVFIYIRELQIDTLSAKRYN